MVVMCIVVLINHLHGYLQDVELRQLKLYNKDRPRYVAGNGEGNLYLQFVSKLAQLPISITNTGLPLAFEVETQHVQVLQPHSQTKYSFVFMQAQSYTVEKGVLVCTLNSTNLVHYLDSV